MAPTILVIEDKKQAYLALQQSLEQGDYRVRVAHKGLFGLQIIQNETPSLVLLDLNITDMDGMEVLKQAKKVQPDLPVIILSDSSSLDTAINTMKLGAADFITKPFDYQKILTAIKQNINSRIEFLKPGLNLKYNNFVGRSRAMQEVKKLINQVARSNANILISGESGTGKEVAAITIHQNSPRRKGPFVPINCAALPEPLMESELFGHEKGAFTGAVSRKPGRFEVASGGTVFLDEIAEMPLNMQAKLLRVLQEKAFVRVGGTETLTANVRIIAATNRQLSGAIENGTFREDLYYRLNVIQIHIPPLRERQEDIADLAEHFIEKFQPTYGVDSISPEAVNLLTRYDWPGNIRELQNVIERAAIICEGNEILPGDLPGYLKENNIFRGKDTSTGNIILTFPEHGLSLEELEKELLLKALEKSGGNQTRAAKLLGITRSAFLYRSQKHGICYN